MTQSHTRARLGAGSHFFQMKRATPQRGPEPSPSTPAGTDPESLLNWLRESHEKEKNSEQVERWRDAVWRIRTLRSLSHHYTPPPLVHHCSRDTCDPVNELAFGRQSELLRIQKHKDAAPEPLVYVCRSNVPHVCQGERFRPEGAPEFVPCHLYVQDGQKTCLISGRSYGTTFSGRGISTAPLHRKRRRTQTDRDGHVIHATHGETDGDERPGRKIHTGDEIVLRGGQGQFIGEIMHPRKVAQQRRESAAEEARALESPATKRVRAVVDALQSGTYDPNRMQPTCTTSRAPAATRSPPESPRRRRRNQQRQAPPASPPEEAASPVSTVALVPQGGNTKVRRLQQLRNMPVRAECRDLIRRIFYHGERMMVYKNAARDAMTQACKAHKELVETAQKLPLDQRPTHMDALSQFIRIVRPVVFDMRPAQTVNEEVIAYLETILILHWNILLDSPYIAATPSHANFQAHCLALLDCMASIGYIWRDRLIVPPVDYVARYMPRQIERCGLQRSQFTTGMSTMRKAYDTIPVSRMPFERLQRCFSGEESRYTRTNWGTS